MLKIYPNLILLTSYFIKKMLMSSKKGKKGKKVDNRYPRFTRRAVPRAFPAPPAPSFIPRYSLRAELGRAPGG